MPLSLFQRPGLFSRTFLMFLVLFIISGPLTAFDASADDDDDEKPVSLSWKGKLKFGTVASDINAPGTVIIDAVANSRSITGAAFDFGGTWRRGKFQIKGEKKAYVNVTLPSSIVMQNPSGAYSITVTNLHMNLTNPIRLSNKGKKTVYVGGTLNISINQKPRTYKDIGTLVIHAEYL